MRVLLVRHGETVDNVAGLYAGVTDSALTNHGVLQATRLATHVATRFRFTHIFASDLQRAYKTAIAIKEAQQQEISNLVEVYKLKILQEQNFGSFEKMTFAARAKAAEDKTGSLEQPETKEAMAIRANQFLDDFLLPILFSEIADEQNQVAVVSHGLLLSTLWRCILKRFPASNVQVARGIELPVKEMPGLEHIGAWTNTGYLDLLVEPTGSEVSSDAVVTVAEGPELLTGHKMTILAINSKEHLTGLKRTGGGVGSSKHDESQKSIDSFFKRPRRS